MYRSSLRLHSNTVLTRPTAFQFLAPAYSIMRRGRNSAEDSDVRSPLLGEASDSFAVEKGNDGDGKTPSEFDERHNRLCDAVALAWNLILDLMKKMLCRVAALLAVVFPFKQQSLTEQQEERLRELWYRSQIPFDSNTPKHLDALKQLWHAAFPDTPWAGQKSAKWSEMGWQGMDPATDFRGGGFLALENLCDLHRLDPVLFQRLLNKSEGERSDWEYPFAVAGVNLTFTMTEMLQLRTPKTVPGKTHARGFLHLLEAEEEAFAQLFCIMFALLDKNWLELKAGYMEFPIVMRTTRQQVEQALGHQPRSMKELRRLLAL